MTYVGAFFCANHTGMLEKVASYVNTGTCLLIDLFLFTIKDVFDTHQISIDGMNILSEFIQHFNEHK